jgi:hypothetical protein
MTRRPGADAIPGIFPEHFQADYPLNRTIVTDPANFVSRCSNNDLLRTSRTIP